MEAIMPIYYKLMIIFHFFYNHFHTNKNQINSYMKINIFHFFKQKNLILIKDFLYKFYFRFKFKMITILILKQTNLKFYHFLKFHHNFQITNNIIITVLF